jgi:outer membrane protein assembly factor BamB
MFGVALGALLLAGCSRGPAQTWPGVNADSQYAYVAQGQQVHAVNLADGKPVWSFPTAAGSNISQIVARPGIGQDMVVVGSEGPSGTYSGIAYGLDRATGTQKWCLAFDEKGASSQNCPMVDGGVKNGLFGIAPAVDDRILGGINVTNGTAYFGLASGMVYAVDVETGKDKWHFKAERDVWAPPLLVDQTLYVTSLDHHVYALDVATGTVKWQKDMGAAVAGDVAYDQGMLFLGTFGNQLVALDAATGDQRWSFPTQNWVWSAPAIGKGVLYLADVTGNVFAVDEATGQQVWMVKPGGEMRARPTLDGDTLYVGDYDGHLFALSTADGSNRWPDRTTKGQILVSPIVVSDTVLIAPYTGNNLLEAYSATGDLRWPYNPSK